MTLGQNGEASITKQMVSLFFLGFLKGRAVYGVNDRHVYLIGRFQIANKYVY